MHQYLFFIGDFPVRMYGLFFSLGIFSGCIAGYYFLKKDGRGWHESLFDLGLTIAVAGIIGGRLWDVFFFDWDYYHNHLLEIPYVWQGGMAIQGGLIFAFAAAFFFLRKRNIPVLPAADLLAPAIILGQSVGRMANFLNGDAFGHPTGSAFGLLYPHTTLAYATYGAQPLWPAEVWEGQGDILIFVLLLWFSSFRHARGTVFFLYIMLYSVLRFCLEWIRGDYGVLLWGLKSAQLTSIAAFILALGAFLYCRWKFPPEEHQKS